MGDYNLRELDFETYLVGAVTDKIIDADRLARREASNGFPGWALYRTFLCGDHLFRTQARDWCVAYAIAVAEGGAVRTGQPADMMGCLVGWDVYYRMHYLDWMIAGQDVADVAGVDPKTYRKLRNRVYAAVKHATNVYFVELQIAIRRVWKMDRLEGCGDRPLGRLNLGRAYGDLDLAGTGNYRAVQEQMADKVPVDNKLKGIDRKLFR